tara:strand:+ start:575 stop:763 length:189 start_codon:yes stop_codon:yes gene_type:complete
MKFNINIESGNAAFESFADKETARILREVAERIENTGDLEGVCRDHNGNRVGSWEFDGELVG